MILRKAHMRRSVPSVVTAAVVAMGMAAPAWADNDEFDAAKLAPILREATVPLDQGLTVSEREGQPISAKYEIKKGVLQLSIYTMAGGKFFGVIVDHKSGAIEKAEPITDREDLKNAWARSRAMAKAKMPLVKAVSDAVASHDGYRAVRVVPVMMAGVVPVAVITLMKGEDVQEIMAKLD